MKYKIFVAFLIILTASAKSQQPQNLCGFDNYYQELITLNPSVPSLINDFHNGLSAFRSSNTEVAEPEIVIPVVFHVVYSSNHPEQNISDDQILNQMAILNACFKNSVSNTNSVDTKISFCLARRSNTGLTTTGITRHLSVNDQFIISQNYPSDRIDFTTPYEWDSKKYLNIWVGNIKQEENNQIIDLPGQSNIAGFANPFGVDGILLHYKYVGAIGEANIPNYKDGKTLVHEVGHWLGLFHTFHNSSFPSCKTEACNLDGDKLCDTPPVFGPCSKLLPNPDPIWPEDHSKRKDCMDNTINAENYMDYNDHPHMTFFTLDQKAKMRYSLETYRNYFYYNSINNINSLATECSPPSTTGTSPTYFSNCSGGNYPDEWLRINGNEASQYIDLCEGTYPIINLKTPNNCMNLPLHKEYVKCSDYNGSHDGNCWLSPNNANCQWLCEKAEACRCYFYSRKIFISISYQCDDDFNCNTEIQRWLSFPNWAVIPQNFDVAQELNIDFTHLNSLNGNQNKKYIIKFATFDVGGNWRSGQKYITFIPSIVTFPSQFPNGFANKTQKASDQINFVANCLIPNNSSYVASNEIRLQDETRTNGLIESSFKTESFVCSSLNQKSSNSQKDSSNVKVNTIESAERIDVQKINDFFTTKNLVIKQNSRNTLKVSPNPGNGIYDIIYNKNELNSINIYNSKGDLIKSCSLENNTSNIDISSFAASLYLFVISFNDGTSKSIKVIKE